MAYQDAWDESAPAGSVNANTIDTIIQNFKRSIRERLEDLLPTWSTDGTDPKGLSNAYLTRSTDQTIATGTSTAMIWDTEDFDNAGYVNLGSQPTRITIPATGLYLISGNIEWAVGTTGARFMSIELNGSSFLSTVYGVFVTGTPVKQSISIIKALTATEYVRLSVSHVEGGDLNVLTGRSTSFGIMRIN